jgi:hypothetical protein
MLKRSFTDQLALGSLVVMAVTILAAAGLGQDYPVRLRSDVFTSDACRSPSCPHQPIDQLESSKPIIRSVGFFAWWWSEEQLRAGIDLTNPPRKSYVRFDLWKDHPSAGPSYPETLDIVCVVSNPEARPTSYSVELTSDYLVAPVNYPCKWELGHITEEISWSGTVKLSKHLIRLRAGQTKSIAIKGFDLRAVLRDFSGTQESDYLWLWKLRVHALASSARRELADRAQATLTLMPTSTGCGK